MANVRNAVTGLLGYLFGAGNCLGNSATRVAIHRHMGKKATDKISTGAELDALTAQKVFGWKHAHKHDGELIGKKQDKAGRWRSAKVPSYSTDPVHAYAIDERMKQLGARSATSKSFPESQGLRGFHWIGPRLSSGLRRR